jgi:hypothetical protein
VVSSLLAFRPKISATCPAHLIVLALIIQMMIAAEVGKTAAEVLSCQCLEWPAALKGWRRALNLLSRRTDGSEDVDDDDKRSI